MRLGLTLSAIDNTLYDAFGQRQVSTIYNALNQYHVVMELAPRYWQDPRTLDQIYVSTSGANPTGVQQTGIAAGDFTSSTGPASTAAIVAAVLAGPVEDVKSPAAIPVCCTPVGLAPDVET